jgi:hypothetical protein
MYNALLVLVTLVFTAISIAVFSALLFLIYLIIHHKANILKIKQILQDCYLVIPFIRISNWLFPVPYVPTSGSIVIGNCTLFLAKLPFKLKKDRLMLEILCYFDLYYHQKRSNVLSITKKSQVEIITAISEEAFIQSQWLLKSSDFQAHFESFVNKYLSNIQWSTDALQAYNPESSKIYFSSY